MNVLRKQLYQNTFLKSFNFKPIYLSTSNFIVTSPSLPTQSRPTSLHQYQQTRSAGHSKWANIKNVKSTKDQERSKETTKFNSLMRIAVRDGGGADPKLNSKLAGVISQIKSAKLPMGSFDKLLSNMQAKKEAKAALIAVKGPGRCTFVVDILSDNLNRARQDVNTILKKHGGLLAEDSVLYQFEHKGVILSTDFEGKPVKEEHLDDAIAHAIEAGADDVILHTDHPDFGTVLEFATSPSAFFRVKDALEALKYNIVHGDVEYIPSSFLELDENSIQAALKLYEKLSDHPDVNRVYANIA